MQGTACSQAENGASQPFRDRDTPFASGLIGRDPLAIMLMLQKAEAQRKERPIQYISPLVEWGPSARWFLNSFYQLRYLPFTDKEIEAEESRHQGSCHLYKLELVFGVLKEPCAWSPPCWAWHRHPDQSGKMATGHPESHWHSPSIAST